MGRRSRRRYHRSRKRRNKSLICNPNELSCFLKERKGLNIVADSAHFQFYWDLEAFTYTPAKKTTIETPPNCASVEDQLELGLRRVKRAACCCYKMTNPTDCFYILTFLSFVILALLAVFIAVKSYYHPQTIILSSLGLLLLWGALQGCFILMWYLFNKIRAS